MKTVVMSQKQAEWAGNAVAVAGGWIAVGCDRVNPGEILALVPDHWETYLRTISVLHAATHLRDSVNGEEDAKAFLETLGMTGNCVVIDAEGHYGNEATVWFTGSRLQCVVWAKRGKCQVLAGCDKQKGEKIRRGVLGEMISLGSWEVVR